MDLQNTGLGCTSEYIYEDLHNKIENLYYLPGERLSENELCSLYGGASRHAVRGALIRLKEINFIDVFPHRGTYVSLIDLNYIEAILFLRQAVEQKAIELICGREDNSELIQKLTECVKKQKRAWDTSSQSKYFYEIDDEFHRLLLESVDKLDVLKLYEKQYACVKRWRNLEVAVHNRMKELPAEHEKIVGYIENRDSSRAREFIHYHIDTVGRYRDQMKKLYPKYFV